MDGWSHAAAISAIRFHIHILYYSQTMLSLSSRSIYFKTTNTTTMMTNDDYAVGAIYKGTAGKRGRVQDTA